MEVIKGIVDNIKPKLIIVIDSLASKSIERISSTVQLSDTGIVPGAGVGNARNEISQVTLGIPVIAIGVPMVVEAATIAADSIDVFIEKLQNEGESNDYLNKLKDEDKYNMMDIDFESLAKNEDNETIKTMHEYFGSLNPTTKNKYTGIFEGKNLITLFKSKLSKFILF